MMTPDQKYELTRKAKSQSDTALPEELNFSVSDGRLTADHHDPILQSKDNDAYYSKQITSFMSRQ